MKPMKMYRPENCKAKLQGEKCEGCGYLISGATTYYNGYFDLYACEGCAHQLQSAEPVNTKGPGL